MSDENILAQIEEVVKASANRDSSHYLTNREMRFVTKNNRKFTKVLEKRKKRYCKEEEYLTEMKNPENIVEIEDLNTFFFTDAGISKAVNGVTFEIPRGSIVGVVGESGCGKSVTSLSLMQLVQGPHGQIVSGSIRFAATDFELGDDGKYIQIGEDGEGMSIYKTKNTVYDVAKMPAREIRRLRGKEIAMIFQEPMTSLNPVFTIGNQLDEVTLLHIPGSTKKQAKQKSIEMLNLVGIAMPENVYTRFPHELSGGMRQRVMIAMALACKPKLIIADEPTTALDVTIQAQILDLLKEIKHKVSGSILLITHDLGVIAGMADYIVVMYAGKVVERGTVWDIFDHPMHPYTVGLQKSKPVVNRNVDWLYNIPGNVPNPVNLPNYCYFRDRCNQCVNGCEGEYPEMIQVSETHYVSCHRYDGKEKG